MTDGLVKVAEVLDNLCWIPINFSSLKEEALVIKIAFVFMLLAKVLLSNHDYA